VKPGELERNLSRLGEMARTARDRLAALEREMTELRHEMETLAARSPAAAPGSRSEQGEPSSASLDSHGKSRREPAPRAEGDVSGPEAGSE
jgi:phage shock protein A